MKYFAFILSIACIFLLFYVMLSPAKEVANLDGSDLRESVSVRGIVQEERGISTGTIFIVNDISLRCDCFSTYKGKFIVAEGYVDEFKGERFVRVQSIRVVR